MLVKEIPESKLLNVNVMDSMGRNYQIISYINPVAKTWAVRREDSHILYLKQVQMAEWVVKE